MDRRAFTLGLGALALGGCSTKTSAPPARSSEPSIPSPVASSRTLERWKTLSFEASSDIPDGEEALLFAPDGSSAWPTLVALHGRGEAGRGLSAGSHGWRDDYDLEAMHEALLTQRLSTDAAHGFLSDERLGAIDASLASSHYAGVSVVCPYTPVVSDPSPAGAEPFGRFVVGPLLAAVAKARGTSVERARTGIDGVSMGGRLALLVGLAHPEVFGSIGALQPAIRVEEASDLADLASRAREKIPFAMRLVSSDGDPFLEAVRAFSSALDQKKVPHGLVITAGPHDYVWNKGPGSAEMLSFHERALRGLPAP